MCQDGMSQDDISLEYTTLDNTCLDLRPVWPKLSDSLNEFHFEKSGKVGPENDVIVSQIQGF